MNNPSLAFIVSFIAMVLIACSYFFKQKRLFLRFQALGIIFLILSYLFTGEYFAMVGIAVGLGRTLAFYAYEKRDKNAPIFVSFLFSGLTLLAYFTVNFWVLKTAKPLDTIYLVALIINAFIMRIRNLKILRLTVLVPTLLCIVYNIVCNAVVFVIISYSFELCANIVSIFKYHILGKDEKQVVTKEL